MMRRAAGHIEERSVEAEAGALLRAEAAHNLHALTAIVHAFLSK